MLISALLPACIEPYVPRIEPGETKKYVISGSLTTGQEDQVVRVSLVSSISEPQIIPLPFCQVRIADRKGNVFEGYHYGTGQYSIHVPFEYMTTGMEYRLEVITPAGLEIVSEYERLLACPEIDSVYYFIESIPTRDPSYDIQGIQFYLDLDATGYENVYYRFEVVETWEHEASYPIEWYFDGEALQQVSPPDWSHYRCWDTQYVPEIFVLNTGELTGNTYRAYPLHFIDRSNIRLSKLYSMLVKQYAISEQTYYYWDHLRQNNLEEKGLYETQPLPVRGNLKCLSHPDQSVLGNFEVSAVRTRRIWIREVPGLELNYRNSCMAYLLMFGLRELMDLGRYPVYLLNYEPGLAELSDDCVLCEEKGGIPVKPDFWP